MSRSTRRSRSAVDQLLLLGVALLDALPERVAHLVDLAGLRRTRRSAKSPPSRPNSRVSSRLQRLEVPLARDRPACRRRCRPSRRAGPRARSSRYSRVSTVLVLAADLALEDLPAQRVDALALLVHHVVVLEEVLADGEVLGLHLLLRALDGARHHPVLDRHALFHAEPLHQARDAVRPEDPHQVVFEREVEARRAGVALAAGAAAQLVVDAARLVALGADDVQAADARRPPRARRPSAS